MYAVHRTRCVYTMTDTVPVQSNRWMLSIRILIESNGEVKIECENVLIICQLIHKDMKWKHHEKLLRHLLLFLFFFSLSAIIAVDSLRLDVENKMNGMERNGIEVGVQFPLKWLIASVNVFKLFCSRNYFAVNSFMIKFIYPIWKHTHTLIQILYLPTGPR